MNILQEIEKLLALMTRGEKAQVLQWVVRDLGEAFPGIDSRPEVCGGEPCIVRTRIPVWLLVQAKRLGVSEAELLRCYPTLRAEDLANAWGYCRAQVTMTRNFGQKPIRFTTTRKTEECALVTLSPALCSGMTNGLPCALLRDDKWASLRFAPGKGELQICG